MTKKGNPHAARATEGLPGNARAAWRRCAKCDMWVICAFTDAHVVMLEPKALSRAHVIKALLAGELVYQIKGRDDMLPGVVVWRNPTLLARELLDMGGVPPHLYGEHPHRRSGFKPPDGTKKKSKGGGGIWDEPMNTPPPF